jgi:hypothetical protein
MAEGLHALRFRFSCPIMFNFSANHLFLLSRTEYPSCAVFLLRDLDTKRVYRLYDFTNPLFSQVGQRVETRGKLRDSGARFVGVADSVVVCWRDERQNGFARQGDSIFGAWRLVSRQRSARPLA